MSTRRPASKARTGLWYLALLAFSIVYGLSMRAEVVNLAQRAGAPANVWDHALRFMLDPYYLAYFFTLIWLVSSSVAIHRHFNVPALIRHGSCRCWWRRSLRHAALRLAPLLLIWLTSAAITSAGLPMSWGWSAASTIPVTANQVLGIVSVQGLPPALVLVLQLALVGLTFLALHATLATLYLLVPRQFVTYTAAAIIFLTQMVSFRSPIEAAPFLDPANFLLLHRAFTAYHPIALVFLPLAAVIVLCYLLTRYRDRQRATQRRFPVSYPVLLYAGLCALGLVYALVFELHGETNAPTDVLLAAFYGVSADGFKWNLYLYSSIVFLGFAYLFLLALDNELNGRIYYVALRHGTATRWLARFLLPFAGRALSLLAALFAGAVLTSLLGSPSGGGNAAAALDLDRGWLVYQFFVNGTLQLLCYLLIVFVTAWLSSRPMTGLFALACLLVATLPTLNSAQLLPAGLNSLGYTGLGGAGLTGITAVLTTYLIVLLLAAMFIVKKPQLFFTERD